VVVLYDGNDSGSSAVINAILINLLKRNGSEENRKEKM
jgi:hypothetical protein